MNNAKVEGYLGLARRANYVLFGETALHNVPLGRIKLLIVASDSSQNTMMDVARALADHPIANYVYGTKESLAALFGKKAVAIIGIINDGLARQLKIELEDSHDAKEKSIPKK
ncbi:MAG TPA: hypothetical protein DCM23_01870 [Firmicutes bacterium]|jgi:ribosomal protein L7Ae-like RNA K-turn-binding protein|nr:hypothetical protein [Bacillota bacterium]HAV20179.1 hypothetical protein [Bacillota bacterium]